MHSVGAPCRVRVTRRTRRPDQLVRIEPARRAPWSGRLLVRSAPACPSGVLRSRHEQRVADALAGALRRGGVATVNGTSADLRGPPATKVRRPLTVTVRGLLHGATIPARPCAHRARSVRSLRIPLQRNLDARPSGLRPARARGRPRPSRSADAGRWPAGSNPAYLAERPLRVLGRRLQSPTRPVS